MEEKTGIIRDEQGRFVEGVSGNPEGRPKEDENKKLVKKAIKQLVEEYKESLAEALPQISPILIKKASEGDMSAIKELNDILVDKAPKNVDITSGGKPIPILGSITSKNDFPTNNSIKEDISS